MAYINISTAANQWGITPRRVQELCKNGTIEGATRFGRAWMIPEGTPKPTDRRKKNSQDKPDNEVSAVSKAIRLPMPLINTPYKLGDAMSAIEAIEDIDSRNIAMAEYYYFTGQSEKASVAAEPYLMHEDLSLKLSACWIYGYANLSLNRTAKTRLVQKEISDIVGSFDENTPEEHRALATCISTAASVLLHLPLPKILNPLKQYIHMTPPGLRLFVLYVEAHHSYLNKQYGAAIGIAETALALESELYPIASIYLHLVATMGYINLKHVNHAKQHLLEAWEIAQPDNMIQAFGEHHGLLGGMLEAVIKKEFPNDFAKIISITYNFSRGWRAIHNPTTGDNIADDLTTTEFAVAMLASKDWSNKEISIHLGISTNTVKLHISSALQKLNISQRKDLVKFMLK